MQTPVFETNINDFSLHDFINDSNFEQFIDLIRGENEDPNVNFDPNYDEEVMFGGGFIENQFYPNPVDMFNANSGSISDPTSIPNCIANSLAVFSCDIDIGDGGENDGDYTSAVTTPTTTTTKGTKADRSRTLVSERKRRGRMKEKLYALRALVPNITKMDKASIIGDAVSYVQDLQMQAKRLKAEIAVLESSLNGGGRSQAFVQTPTNKSYSTVIKQQICKKILQMDVFQVEEKEFYVRLASNKGEGVAVALYKALESLSSFDIHSSNFTTVSERFTLTFTVNARECGEDMTLSTLKLWVTGALLNQGFEFKV